MKILNADFITSAARADDIPRDDLARIALVGRSNVGKSSLINALCRATIARTSAAPGKTRLVNFYRVTLDGGAAGPGRWSAYLVDLPGYGYARGGADAAWSLVSAANLFVQQTAPWGLAKSGKNSELDETLAALGRALSRLAVLASPFIPGKAQALWSMLGLPGEVADASWHAVEQPQLRETKIRRSEVLFPKPVSV